MRPLIHFNRQIFKNVCAIQNLLGRPVAFIHLEFFLRSAFIACSRNKFAKLSKKIKCQLYQIWKPDQNLLPSIFRKPLGPPLCQRFSWTNFCLQICWNVRKSSQSWTDRCRKFHCDVWWKLKGTTPARIK